MSKIDHEAFAWLARQQVRGLDDAESAAFDAWYQADIRHQGAYARAMAIHNAIHLVNGNAPLPRQHGRRRKFIAGAMAAGLAAIAGKFTYSALWPDDVLTTAKGEFRKVPLQDNSIININSGSQLEVAYTERQRKIRLRQGEAWFEVAKDASKPFIVEAGDALARAVGTAFSVRRLATGCEVLVTEGTVEVWSKDGKARRRLVSAGEHAYLGRGAGAIPVSRQPEEIKRRLAWREGKLLLSSQTLDEAVADFNRYSAKTIVIADPSLRDKRLVGQYQLDEPELFAKDISMILDVPVLITSGQILIGQAREAGRSHL
ncbi:FecR family protein [Oxalobacteraceae bacterium A2-2]